MRRLWLVASAAAPPGPDPRFPGGLTAVPAPVVVPTQVGRLQGLVERAGDAQRSPDDPAAATCAALDVDARPVVALQAPDFGTWAGRPIGDVAAAEAEALTAWRTDPAFRPGGGESLEQLCRRVAAWLAAESDREGAGLVVADAAVVRAAVVVAMAAGPESCWHLDVGPLAVARVQWADGAVGSPGTELEFAL